MGYVQDRLAEIAQEPAVIFKALGNIEKWKSRHGKTYYYYREGKGKRIRLPDRDEVPETVFQRAYEAASRGVAMAKPQRTPPSGKFTRPGKPGYVYFIRSKATVKIGFTTRVRERLSAHQVSNAEDLELLMVMPATDETEKFFHAMFRDYRIAGEWFSLTGLLAEFLGKNPT